MSTRTLALDELAVRIRSLSVDPFMRLKMGLNPPRYMDPYPLGQPLAGYGVAEVVAAGEGTAATSGLVVGWLPWADSTVVARGEVRSLPPGTLADGDVLGAVGMPGLSAYVALFELGGIEPGKTVLISSAAGTVGLVGGQLARSIGCRVVGTTRSSWKLPFLRRLGFNSAFAYSADDDLDARIRTSCPDGIDLAVENVGGAMLDAVIDNMKPGGRVVSCGAISTYNRPGPRRGPSSLHRLVARGIRLNSFNVAEFTGRRAAFEALVAPLVSTGRLVVPRTVLRGLEQAGDAFRMLFTGQCVGKVLVRVAPGAS